MSMSNVTDNVGELSRKKRKRDAEQQQQHPKPLDDVRSNEDDEDTNGIEVLGAGFIVKAPLPIEQAAIAEKEVGSQEGEYFVELMRKKFQYMHDMQVRWTNRMCNTKNAKYMETQMQLKNFTEIVLVAFSTQFGSQSKTMVSPQTRKHAQRKTKK